MTHPARGGAVFRPRFSLTILYFAGFFLLYCAGLAAPVLLDVWRSMPPGPEQQAASFDATCTMPNGNPRHISARWPAPDATGSFTDGVLTSSA